MIVSLFGFRSSFLNYALKPLPQVMGGLRMWLSGAVEHPVCDIWQHASFHGGPAQQWRHSPTLTGRALEFQIFNYLSVHTFTRFYKQTHTFIQQILTEHVLCPNHFLGMIRIQQFKKKNSMKGKKGLQWITQNKGISFFSTIAQYVLCFILSLTFLIIIYSIWHM